LDKAILLDNDVASASAKIERQHLFLRLFSDRPAVINTENSRRASAPLWNEENRSSQIFDRPRKVIMEWMIQGLQKLGEIRPEALESVLGDIKHQRPEIFRSLIIIAYIDGMISLSKAAELLGATRRELERDLRGQGISIRSISDEDVASEVEMLRACCF
jgi:predicted HTH domain antitoxin